jgi:subtilisin family serine protease
MSLGGGASQALDDAVASAVGAGVVFVVAAGNSNANACNSSPARTPSAITVGATASNDARASFSNFGTCVDIFAPGQQITSSWSTSDTATNTISGTSMASPHVAGVVALNLSQFGNRAPATVAAALNSAATLNVVGGAGTGSPNRLLFSIFGSVQPTPTLPPRPTPPVGAPIAVVAVADSGNDGNGPANAIDNNLATRWSSLGNGQWIRFDLGAARAIGTIGLAFYQGNTRTATFDLQLSNDGASWTTVRANVVSSGGTLNEQRFTLTGTARFVRYLGHGNSVNLWNSLTEVKVYTP